MQLLPPRLVSIEQTMKSNYSMVFLIVYASVLGIKMIRKINQSSRRLTSFEKMRRTQMDLPFRWEKITK